MTPLADNARAWLRQQSLKDIAVLLDAIEDTLIERHCPGAALVSQARTMVERQANGGPRL